MRNILTLLLVFAVSMMAHAEELSIFNYIKIDQPAAKQQQVMKQDREISIYDHFKPEMRTIPAEAPASVSLNAGNSIWINSFNAIPETKMTLYIYASHEVTIQGLQFKIELPKDLYFSTTNSELNYSLNSYYSSGGATYTLSNSNRTLTFSFSGNSHTGLRTFGAHSGVFMTVDVNVGRYFETSTFNMTNMQFNGFPAQTISVADRSVLAAADKGSSRVFIENFDILPGEVKDVPVMISHNEPMGAFQFDLEIPNGYRLVAGTDGYPYFEMNDTYNNGYSGSSYMNGGRFVVAAPTNATGYVYWPATNKHEIMKIRIAASDNARAGKQDTLRVVEQVLSGQTHPSMRPETQYTAITQEEMPKMYINNFSINPGETKTVVVKCKHNMAITGAQLDIEMPEGLSIKANAQGDPGFTVDNHYSGASIKQSGFQSNGDARIFFVRNNTWEASPAEGDLLTIEVVADDSFTGSGIVKIKNSLFTGNGSNGQALAYYLPDVTCTVTREYDVVLNVKTNNITITPGETANAMVYYASTEPTKAMTFEMTLPRGLDFVKKDNGTYDYSISPMFSSLRALVSAVDSRARTVKVTIMPTSSGRTIPAYDGSRPIFAIGITTTANFFQGTGNMSNVQYVNSDGVTVNVPNSTFRIALADEQLSIDIPKFKIVKGSMMQIVPKSSYGTQPTFTFTSSDENVATVNERGFITAVGSGTATITATANSKSVTSEVTVVTFEDMNGDSNTDVTDVNLIISHILNK